jgi:four helix bundle protein
MITNNNPIVEKSLDFAIRIVKLSRYLRTKKKEYVLSKQILKSGTSIGANIAEAQRGQTKADFVAKMSISLKEANETMYWLMLLYRTDILTTTEYESLYKDLDEILSLLTAICKTATL